MIVRVIVGESTNGQARDISSELTGSLVLALVDESNDGRDRIFSIGGEQPGVRLKTQFSGGNLSYWEAVLSIYCIVTQP